MMTSALPMDVYAEGNNPNEGIMPLYDCSSKVTTAAVVDGKTVQCKSAIVIYPGEKWSTITQTIEKKSSSGSWSSTSYTWTKTADKPESSYIYNNSTTLSSGTYRVRSDLVVKFNGTSETVTTYSLSFTI